MSTIVCPKCKSETPEDDPQCQYCGKYLIKTPETPKKSTEELDDEDLFSELDKDEDSLLPKGVSLKDESDEDSDEDLFKDLEPLELDEDEGKSRKSKKKKKLSGTKGTNPKLENIKKKRSKKRNIEEEDDDDDLPTFVNPMEKSNLLKKIKEDHELFGDLEKEK